MIVMHPRPSKKNLIESHFSIDSNQIFEGSLSTVMGDAIRVVSFGTKK